MIFERKDTDGIAILSMKTPGSRVNVVDLSLFRELGEILDDIGRDDAVSGMVLISGKPGQFGVGADLDWVSELARSHQGHQEVMEIHQLMSRLYWSPKPLVTGVDGMALGGALELALTSRSILGTPRSIFGLPEARLGLMPGGGGTVLLPRFVDPSIAVELLTTGHRIDSARARALGLISDIADPEELAATAVAVARNQADEDRKPWIDDSGIMDAVQHFETADKPASTRIIQSVSFSSTHSLEESLAEERRLFFEQIGTVEARAGIHLFRSERDLKRHAGTPQRVVSRLGVIGAGLMGAGIAATAALHSIDVSVRDVDQAALGRARDVFKRTIDRHSKTVENSPGSWNEALAWDAFSEVDAVIEAVYESEDVKVAVLAELSKSVPEESLIATNTSALSVEALAGTVVANERFLGVHFFNPVDRMRLVELVPHPGTSTAALRRASDLGRQMKKIPVVVADRPGFFTSRVFARWLIEGMHLLLEGAEPDAIDLAATTAGFASGPMVAIDEASVDLVLAASINQVASKLMAPRLQVDSVASALSTLSASGLGGKRVGAGLYSYDEQGKRIRPSSKIRTVLGISGRGPARDEIIDRLVMSFVSESLLAWDEGVLCHPDDGDFAAVAGIGFPKAFGGPFHHVDELGPKTVIDKMTSLGPNFPAGSSLPHLAGTGLRFESLMRSSLPEPRPPV